jgi:hypothetical protein
MNYLQVVQEIVRTPTGSVLNRRQHLVQGRYELPAPPPGSPVALKVIDMLDEELVLQWPLP